MEVYVFLSHIFVWKRICTRTRKCGGTFSYLNVSRYKQVACSMYEKNANGHVLTLTNHNKSRGVSFPASSKTIIFCIAQEEHRFFLEKI